MFAENLGLRPSALGDREMGNATGIEWANATVNIWLGCTKISPACKHCYAETNSPVRVMEGRLGEQLGIEPSEDGKRRLKMWGGDGFRYETASWERELRKLNQCAFLRRRNVERRTCTVGDPDMYTPPRVFINSLSDIFEDWDGPVYRIKNGALEVVRQSLNDVRERFFRVAVECTELDLLLLTKRPQNVGSMVPMSWVGSNDFFRTHGGWPRHVWLGTTVENQEMADRRIPELLSIDARVRFLSMEPLLGPVGISGLGPINWVIVGGESGRSARPMHPNWVRSIRDQCTASNVPFFFKQWGEWRGYSPHTPEFSQPVPLLLRGAEVHRWSGAEDGPVAAISIKVGKKNAGRLLDGREWNEVPK